MSQSPSAVELAAGPSASSCKKDVSVMTEPLSAVKSAAGPSASSSKKDVSVMTKPLSAVTSAAGPSASSSKKDVSVMTEPLSAVTSAAGPSASSSRKDVRVMTEPLSAVTSAAGPSASSSRKYAGPHEILDADLIEEIKKHPVLFMNARQEHEERIIKKKTWFKICKLLFKYWNSYSLRKKLDTVKELQKRWMDLKEEFFMRQEENRPDSPVPKKHKSIFDNMTFLLEPTDDAPDIEVRPEYSGNDFDPVAQSDTSVGIPTLMPPSPVFNNNLQQQLINLAMPSTSSATLGRKTANVHFTSLVTSLLNDLDKEQNLAIWRDILQLIQEAGERGSCSQELICVPGMGAEPSLVSVPAEETVEEKPSASYPSSQERPRNADGQLIYPETDEEDVEV